MMPDSPAMQRDRTPRPPRFDLQCGSDGRLTAELAANSQEEFVAMFGDVGREFADQALHDLINVALVAAPKPGPVDTLTINALLQAVAGLRPCDEVEAMLAVQLAALHHVTLNCLRRSQQSSATMDGRALNLSQANKCARTFAALLEALAKHRGKCTTQRVIVENVTVQAGGQAVVGAVAGVGGSPITEVQPHATASDHQNPGGHSAALPSPDASGKPVSASGGGRQDALPDARRRGGQRRPCGQQKSICARAI
jgi:hypothetical protein